MEGSATMGQHEANVAMGEAAAKRDEAIAGFFDSMSRLADAGTKLLEAALEEEATGGHGHDSGRGPGRPIGQP